MQESLARFREPRVSGVLADLLIDLIIDIRKILIHPDMQNHVKLAAIATAVDELAPPPQPEEAVRGTWPAPAFRPGPAVPRVTAGLSSGSVRIFAGHDGGSGCAWFRMFVPLRELAKHDGFEVTFAASGDSGGAIEIPVVTAGDLKGHDVIVGQRWNSHGGLDIWRRARNPLNRLVYDLDDDVFNVGPENWNAYSLYNRADIQDATRHSAETADLVTVSTEPLAEVMREYSGNVTVLPNHLPAWVLDLPRQPRGNGRLRIGWGGGASHGLDIGVAANPVAGFLRRFGGWDLQLNGTDYRHTFATEGVPSERMVYVPWVYINADAEGYYTAIDFDVGLCPLNPTPFARSKSALKALEMNARGIPVLASDCEAYRGYVRDGVNGFLIRKPREWLERLCDLAADDALREKMSAASRDCARQHLIEDGWRLWADAYRALFRDGRP